MSNSFVKLLVSQLFANLADIFFRVTIIANIYIISKSVIATSLVPILHRNILFCCESFSSVGY